MGWLDSLKALVSSVDTEYDRRIRSASNVKQYKPDGHGHGHAHEHDQAASATSHERAQGEGGDLGELQSNAGPHVER